MSIWHPDAADTAVRPRVQFNSLAGEWTAVDRTRNTEGGWDERRHIVAEGTMFAADFGPLRTGPLKFGVRGPDFTKLRPYGEPQLAPTELEYKEGLLLDLLFKQFGLRTFASNSVLVNQIWKGLHDHFVLQPQAHAGLLPYYKILPSITVYVSSREQNFHQPALELVGWTKRDARFGERIVPAPKPQLEPSETTTPAPPRVAQDIRYASSKPKPAPFTAELVDDEIPF